MRTEETEIRDDTHETRHHVHLSAHVTGCLIMHSAYSFYDACGACDPSRLPATPAPIIGWMILRRESPLRASLRELEVTKSLSRTLPTAPPLGIVFGQMVNRGEGDGPRNEPSEDCKYQFWVLEGAGEGPHRLAPVELEIQNLGDTLGATNYRAPGAKGGGDPGPTNREMAIMLASRSRDTSRAILQLHERLERELQASTAETQRLEIEIRNKMLEANRGGF